MVMSQEASTKFIPDLKPGGLLLVEQDLVHLANLKAGTRVFRCPGTRIAEELGKRMVLNIVMVGFFTAVTRICSKDNMRKAVIESVPEAFKDLNTRAFDRGYEYGVQKVAEFPNGEDINKIQSPLAVHA